MGDHKAKLAKLPPIDSMNLWPYLSGQADNSPRTEVFADPGVLIVGDWKIIGANEKNATSQRGLDVFVACWMGPQYPNATADPSCWRREPCKANGGCLSTSSKIQASTLISQARTQKSSPS